MAVKYEQSFCHDPLLHDFYDLSGFRSHTAIPFSSQTYIKMEPESSNCSASVLVDVPNPMDVRASKMGKQCFLVYKLDLPTGALSNPRLTHVSSN